MAGTPSCPTREELERLLLGELSDAEAECLEGHVGACAQCLQTLRSLQAEDPLVEAVREGARADGALLEAADEGLIARLCQMPGVTILAEEPPQQPLLDLEKAEEFAAFLTGQGADERGQFGSYRVRRVLGRGGMGVVFLAEDPRVKRVVALKVLLDGRCTDPRYRSRFQREAEAAASLQHPHIVQLHEVGEQQGRPYLVLEFAEGGNLAQKLAEAALAPRAAAELVQVLAEAVHFAHEHGCIHRDLKPANVLLARGGQAFQPDGVKSQAGKPDLQSADYQPKITDFGLARKLDEDSGQTHTGDVLGTPSYMAPEQAAGHSKDIGPAVDVYALGAILYESLTGRPPFKAATVLETLEQVRSQEPVPPGRLQPGLPRDLQTICLKCLAKTPARRYASARELADDLGRFLRGEPIRARAVSWHERLWKWARRRPTLASLLAVTGLSLAALVAGGLVHHVRMRAALERAEAEKANAWEQQRATASAVCQGGLAHWQLGQKEAAVRDFRRAIALLEETPTQPQTQDCLAECYTYLGTLTRDSGQTEECERAYRQALALRQQLAEAHPDQLSYQEGLVQAELLYATARRGAGCWAEAERHCRRALALSAQLSTAHPENDSYRVEQAEACVELGYAEQQLQRRDEAETAFAQAEKLLLPLVRAHPENLQAALSLAAAEVAWSGALQEAGRLEGAREHAGRAVDLAERVLRHEQGKMASRPLTREAHAKRATACEGLGRWADAVQDWDRVIELEEASSSWPRFRRTLALGRAGEYARAVAEAQAVGEDSRITADGLWELALVEAGAATAAGSDPRLSSAEQQVLAEHSAAEAVALLAKLQRQGYFQDPSHVQALHTGEELKGLRYRPDFWKVLLDVERSKPR